MDVADIAWFAGIFEGEGCFSIEKNGNTRITVAMCDEDIIDRIKVMFPTHQNKSPIQPKPREPGGNMPKVRYTWCVSDPDEVKRITELMLPWLGKRRTARANEVLHHLANRPGNGSFHRNKTHCPQGHEYTPENTAYKYKDKPYRTCRTCQKIWWTTRNQKVSAKRAAARATAQSQSPEQ